MERDCLSTLKSANSDPSCQSENQNGFTLDRVSQDSTHVSGVIEGLHNDFISSSLKKDNITETDENEYVGGTKKFTRNVSV